MLRSTQTGLAQALAAVLAVVLPPTLGATTAVLVAGWVVALGLVVALVVTTVKIRPREALQTEMAETSRQIFDLLRLHSAREPNPADWRDDYGPRTISHSRDLMSEYDYRYGARALALFDRAVERGLVEASERWCFEHPTNPLGVREVAQRLGAMAESL